MARKNQKRKKLGSVKTKKARARAQIGMTPGSRVVPDGRKENSDKHKPTLSKLLEEN